MATEMTVEAVVTRPKFQAEAGAMAGAAAHLRRVSGGASYNANETANNDTMVGNGDLQATQSKEEIVEDPPLVKTDRFGFTGGKQFTDEEDGVPLEVIRRREIKWLDMLDDWDKWMSKRPKKVRERCRKGIPSSIRSRAWQYLCGSKKLMEQNKQRWEELDEMEGEHKWVDIISKDLNRQFPFHEMFAQRGGHGQQDLFRILKAYSIYNPRDGYCQGQAPVAAVLLMHMPVEEAFWCFVQVCAKYVTGYYSPGLEAVQVDGQVLHGLLRKVLPAVYKHMNKHRVEPILYITEWFMCIYARTLPWKSVLRVWDMFLCEGVKVIFRVALVLLKNTLARPDQMAATEGLYEIMERLKNIPPELMDDEIVYLDMLKLGVFEKDMEAEHSLQVYRRQVIKQRQKEREGQSTIMSRDIEAIQLRKKNEKKKTKAEESPRRGSPQKTSSQRPVDIPVIDQRNRPPMTTVNIALKGSSKGQGVTTATVISVQPVKTSEGPDKPSGLPLENETPDHGVPKQGENGTPVHRVPPPLPAGVEAEEQTTTDKKSDKSQKKKSQKKQEKEEKEREKAKIKEMKQKEKEEREKLKAQFKATKDKSVKEKGKKDKKKSKSGSVGVVNGDKSPEPLQSGVVNGGGTFQTLETQKEEFVHLSDPKDVLKEGNGHVMYKEEKRHKVTKTEMRQADDDTGKEKSKEIPQRAEHSEELVLPGVKRIDVQEADDRNTVEKRASNILTETDIDAIVQSVGKSKPVENGLESEAALQEDRPQTNSMTKVVHTDSVPETANKDEEIDSELEVSSLKVEQFDSKVETTDEIKGWERTIENGGEDNINETHIDDAESIVIEDFDNNDAEPKGVTAL